MSDVEISAAGTVPWRRDESGQVLLALVHRPKYDDWSFPKGKLEGIESATACAHRETLEETGFDVRLHNYLGEVSYQTTEGLKRVKYWSAKFLQETGSPNPTEVDQVLWVEPTLARDRLNHERYPNSQFFLGDRLRFKNYYPAPTCQGNREGRVAERGPGQAIVGSRRTTSETAN